MLNDIPEFSRLLAVEQFCWKGNFKMAYQVKFHNSFHWDGILRTNIVRNRLRWKSCIGLVWINPMRISLVFVSLRKYSPCYCCENCIWWKQNSSIWLLLIFGFKRFCSRWNWKSRFALIEGGLNVLHTWICIFEILSFLKIFVCFFIIWNVKFYSWFITELVTTVREYLLVLIVICYCQLVRFYY